MLTSICMWSGQACASIISTPFWLHSYLSISPTSLLIFPYTSFRLYFGAKTIWYWHLYFECALLFISLFSFIWKTSCILVMRSSNHYYYTRGSSFFLSARIKLALFFCSSVLFSSLGRTEGLFPRLKTPTKQAVAWSATACFIFSFYLFIPTIDKEPRISIEHIWSSVHGYSSFPF